MQSLSRRNFLGLGALAALGFASGTLTGCSQNQGADAGAASVKAGSVSGDTGDGRTLVAYYSAQGHTKRVAQTLADELGADIFEIVPNQVYTDDDLDWTDDDSRVSREHDDESLRDIPLAKAAPDNWADYDTIILGYPIWWAVAAWPTDHFATDNDFTDKKVITFCTSTSSGLGQSTKLLADAAGTGDWQEGQRFSSSASDDEVCTWAKSL